MRNAQARPQQCWNSCANGSNIVALRFGDHGTKKCWELLAEKFDRFQTLGNNTQLHPTTCNRVCKRTQYVTSNNVGSCWPTMLRPFAQGLTFICSKYNFNKNHKYLVVVFLVPHLGLSCYKEKHIRLWLIWTRGGGEKARKFH